MTDHTTAHAYDGLRFIAGCTCGWLSAQRSTLQAVIADKFSHIKTINPTVWPVLPVAANLTRREQESMVLALNGIGL